MGLEGRSKRNITGCSAGLWEGLKYSFLLQTMITLICQNYMTLLLQQIHTVIIYQLGLDQEKFGTHVLPFKPWCCYEGECLQIVSIGSFSHITAQQVANGYYLYSPWQQCGFNGKTWVPKIFFWSKLNWYHYKVRYPTWRGVLPV